MKAHINPRFQDKKTPPPRRWGFNYEIPEDVLEIKQALKI